MAKVRPVTIRVDAEGRLVLPEAIRAAAQVGPDSAVLAEVLADGTIRLRPLPDAEQAWF